MNTDIFSPGDLPLQDEIAADPMGPFLNALAALLVQPGMSPQSSHAQPVSPTKARLGFVPNGCL